MALPLWLQRLKKYNPTYSSVKTTGSTPVYGYDIDIGQHGKPNRDILKDWAQRKHGASGGGSGLHPGVESGYQGGLIRALNAEDEAILDSSERKYGDLEGYWYPGGVTSKTRTDIAGGEYKNLNKIPTQTTNIVGWKNPKKQGPTAEERAEAWKLAMEDAQGFMGPMPGDTIPGAIVGKKARIETGSYETAGGDIQTAGLLSAAPDAFWKKKLWT